MLGILVRSWSHQVLDSTGNATLCAEDSVESGLGGLFLDSSKPLNVRTNVASSHQFVGGGIPSAPCS